MTKSTIRVLLLLHYGEQNIYASIHEYFQYFLVILLTHIDELHFDISFVKIGRQIKKVTPVDCVKI